MSFFARCSFFLVFFCGFVSPVFAMEVKPPTLDLSARPGTSTESVFVLRNTDAVTETYTFTIQGFVARGEDGRQTFLPLSETAGLPSWLYLNRSTVTLKPGESVPVAVQFRPAKDASPGAYQAAVFATHDDGQRVDGVTLGSRVGVLVFATVEGEAKHALRIDSLQRLTSRFVDHLPVSFEASIRNEGTAHEVPQGHMTITNMLGQLTTTLDLQEREVPLRVLPGSARRFEMKWGDDRACSDGFFAALRCEWAPFAFGMYRARLVIDGTMSVEPSEEVRFFVIPWRTFALVGSVLILLVLGRRLRRGVSVL